MAYPDFNDLSAFTPEQELELRQFAAYLQGYLSRQHAVDGTHSVITERGRSIALGVWTPVLYDAANFSTSGGTWTVEAADFLTESYALIGMTIHVQLSVKLTSVGANVSSLWVKIPGGYTAKRAMDGAYVLINNGAAVSGKWSVAAGQSWINFYVAASANSLTNFTVSTNNTDVYALCTFEVQ